MVVTVLESAISEDHPLALELASLRGAVTRYQHEAHTSSLKLQRHSLDTSHALERAHFLEQENARLKEEVAVLRAHPDITPHPASLQVPELTLALRRLSDKLTLTEEQLHARVAELANARNEVEKAKLGAEAAHHLVARVQARESEWRSKERELEQRARAAEEERRLADLVVQEYADLVRNLEGRSKPPHSPSISLSESASGSSTTLVESLVEGRTGLQKLLEEFNTDAERLSADVSRLQGENDILSSTLETERKAADSDRARLAQALTELDKHQADDNTAAKMVSRYMKFSQSTTDSLQKAMENLRTRHESTLTTLNAQIEHLQKALSSEHRQSETFRSALEELSEDISREAYGRRREISLRLAFLGREESLAENLRRWIRKSREHVHRALSQDREEDIGPFRSAFDKVMQDAESLLDDLNGQPHLQQDSPASVARVVAAQDAAHNLMRELQLETDRRLRLELMLAEFQAADAAISPTGDVPSFCPADEVESPKVRKSNGDAIMPSQSPAPAKCSTLPMVEPAPVPQSSRHAPSSLPFPSSTVVDDEPAPVEATLSIAATPSEINSTILTESSLAPKFSESSPPSISPQAPALAIASATPQEPEAPVDVPPIESDELPADTLTEIPLPNGTMQVVDERTTQEKVVQPSVPIKPQDTSLPDAEAVTAVTSEEVPVPNDTRPAAVASVLAGELEGSVDPVGDSVTTTHDVYPPEFEPTRPNVPPAAAPVTAIPGALESSVHPAGDPIATIHDVPLPEFEPGRPNVPSAAELEMVIPQIVLAPAEDVPEPSPQIASRPAPEISKLGPCIPASDDDIPTTIEYQTSVLTTAYSLNAIPSLPVTQPEGLLFKSHEDVALPAPSLPGEIQSPADNQLMHTLLADLVQVKHRYDDLQRAFRDCHLALKELKKDLVQLPSSANMSAVIQTAVERLDDFNEDTRVELEIRIVDEERILTGYETLLSVPGAISDEVDESEMEREIRAFVDGSDRAVTKAMQQFSRKLDDLEHDIASVKRSMHELSSADPSSQAENPSKSPQPWSSWTASLLGSSRPSPPAPTFGSVMTSPRLRHSSSASSMRWPAADRSTSDPFASLDLRIPMPAYAFSSVPARSRLSSMPAPAQKPRAASTSAMYMLGLGARGSAFGLNTTSALRPSPVSRLAMNTDETDGEEEADSDVE